VRRPGERRADRGALPPAPPGGADLSEILDWASGHTDDIQTALWQHVQIVLIAVLVSIAIWVPVGILVRGRRIPFVTTMSAAGLMYTVPSLALFAILVPIMGIGRNPVIVGLVLYSPLILVRNTVVGLEGVPAHVREAARGMGLTPRQILFRVELPLALPSIVAGIRVVAVSTVGIATIGVLVGAEGIGKLIYTDGLNRFFLPPVAVGAVLATALALLIDVALLVAQRAVSPWTRARRPA
jgi:osmoprotectant transport system permease protein